MSAPLDFNDGYCVICENDAKFLVNDEWLRDHYICHKCGSIPRQRALIHALNIFLPTWRALKIHESSPDGASSDFIKRVAGDYSFSQYFPHGIPGEFMDGIRCENLEQLTFHNESIDIIITQDVLEHVFHPMKAFQEIARVLKPGGFHFFTVPWYPETKTVVRAKLNNEGNIEYVKPPIYHGNPINKKGSLVVHDLGRDFINDIQRHSGLSTMIYLEKNKTLGLDAEHLHVFICEKYS